MIDRAGKARRFREMHTPHDPVLLCNIWDAGSAKAVENAGAKAIATSSWSVAAAQGYGDSEQIPFEAMLGVVARIVETVDLPVSVDFEGGYAVDPEGIAQNVRRLLELGVVGFNIEDQIVKGSGLFDIEVQAARIRAAREAAERLGVPAFINARTDVFLKAAPGASQADLIAEALIRERAYAAAGADGVFVPGLTEIASVARLCDAATLTVNVMISAQTDPVQLLAAAGVARISLGPAPYLGMVTALEAGARAL